MSSYSGPAAAARPGDTAGTLRLLAYLALATTLLVLDHRGGWLRQLRAQADLVAQPVWALAGLPGRVGGGLKEGLASRGALLEENRQLRNDLLLANARLTRLRNAALDNAQLRGLLGVAERGGLDVQLVPILNIDLEPSRQRLVLAAGSRQGVSIGQAVIDAGGLLGQVVGVTPMQSTVLLLTDPDHAVPVMIARNGVRLIAYGGGDRLELRDVPLNRDVQVGDVLVTSGLGGRFPAGFPVATITALRPDESQAFLVGELSPAAQLDRGRDVLLLRVGTLPPATPADPDLPAAGGPAAAPTALDGAAAMRSSAAGVVATPNAPAAAPGGAASPTGAGAARTPRVAPASAEAVPAGPAPSEPRR
ncbi:rod shape-determining protein MreC [Pseudoxanthomonas daejeonensis]|uniref:rod shape-determining protein MreC n=1 Tax=Pseudoxanthomonas daejeonensis TaxID=266062 RepID=UPI001F53F29F|nr:rod shape-determining protein MreC [Pseudoxanthomonas daejeonensis]UNK58459.1 rod shape-determining protein MreC [Pseudoxanthomonas daejeonensis]